MKRLSVSLTRSEQIGGWCYLIAQLFLLPQVLVFANQFLPTPLNAAQVNFTYFVLNFICVTLIFRQYLWKSVKQLLSSPLRCLRFAAIGYLMYYVANFLTGLLIQTIEPNFANANDSNIAEMTAQSYSLMAVGTILLVPPVEELLYRGLIFGTLYQRSRFAAYSVCTVVFSAVHVVGYIGLYPPLTLLLCFIQYFPAGLCLCWAYARADCIFAPMLMHIAINQIGIYLMR